MNLCLGGLVPPLPRTQMPPVPLKAVRTPSPVCPPVSELAHVLTREEGESLGDQLLNRRTQHLGLGQGEELPREARQTWAPGYRQHCRNQTILHGTAVVRATGLPAILSSSRCYRSRQSVPPILPMRKLRSTDGGREESGLSPSGCT